LVTLDTFTVLVVDDEEDIRNIIAYDVESVGYKVFKAESGNKALEILRSVKIDVIISDIRMPDGDGVKLLDTLKRDFPEMPQLIFLSGYSDYSKEELIAKGADSVLKKPVKYEELKTQIALAARKKLKVK
jgi:CheY-like chemotaxis protein